MTIISVSRRTDIPAFYMEWFLNRLEEGYLLYPLPYSNKLKHLSLDPQEIDCIIFWSKNYSSLIPHLSTLDENGYHYYFHFTINNYPDVIEEHVLPVADAIDQVKLLAEHTSTDHVLWRYDPIITTKDFTATYHLYTFEKIASQLQGYIKRCYIEFLDVYKKVETNFDKRGIKYLPITQDQKRTLAIKMASIAEKYDIKLYSCCDYSILTDTVHKARCVDPDLIRKITKRELVLKSGPTRKECGCAKSIDIGEYGSCLHGCLYCYANVNHQEALKFDQKTDPKAPSLDSAKLKLSENADILEKPPDNTAQLKLF